MAFSIPNALPQSVFNLVSYQVNRLLDDPQSHAFTTVLPHQIAATSAIRNHFRDATRPRTCLAVLPTGAGKTGIAVLSAYALNASRVLVVTPSQKISEQVDNAFCGQSCFMVTCGLIPNSPEAANKMLPASGLVRDTKELAVKLRNCLVVMNAHKGQETVEANTGRIAIQDIPKDFDLVIVDEAHHYPADTWKRLVDHFDNANRLFLTATPYRRGTEPIIENQDQCISFHMTRREAVERGVIRDIEFIEVGNLEDDEIGRASCRERVSSPV